MNFAKLFHKSNSSIHQLQGNVLECIVEQSRGNKVIVDTGMRTLFICFGDELSYLKKNSKPNHGSNIPNLRNYTDVQWFIDNQTKNALSSQPRDFHKLGRKSTFGPRIVSSHSFNDEKKQKKQRIYSRSLITCTSIYSEKIGYSNPTFGNSSINSPIFYLYRGSKREMLQNKIKGCLTRTRLPLNTDCHLIQEQSLTLWTNFLRRNYIESRPNVTDLWLPATVNRQSAISKARSDRISFFLEPHAAFAFSTRSRQVRHTFDFLNNITSNVCSLSLRSISSVPLKSESARTPLTSFLASNQNRLDSLDRPNKKETKEANRLNFWDSLRNTLAKKQNLSIISSASFNYHNSYELSQRKSAIVGLGHCVLEVEEKKQSGRLPLGPADLSLNAPKIIEKEKLSRRKLVWTELTNLCHTSEKNSLKSGYPKGKSLPGFILNSVNGGFAVGIAGYIAFLPKSLCVNKKVFIGQWRQFVIIGMNSKISNIVVKEIIRGASFGSSKKRSSWNRIIRK